MKDLARPSGVGWLCLVVGLSLSAFAVLLPLLSKGDTGARVLGGLLFLCCGLWLGWRTLVAIAVTVTPDVLVLPTVRGTRRHAFDDLLHVSGDWRGLHLAFSTGVVDVGCNLRADGEALRRAILDRVPSGRQRWALRRPPGPAPGLPILRLSWRGRVHAALPLVGAVLVALLASWDWRGSRPQIVRVVAFGVGLVFLARDTFHRLRPRIDAEGFRQGKHVRWTDATVSLDGSVVHVLCGAEAVGSFDLLDFDQPEALWDFVLGRLTEPPGRWDVAFADDARFDGGPWNT